MKQFCQKYVNFVSVTLLIELIFIILRVTSVITWAWWWIIAPIWLPWALLLESFIVVWVMGHLLFPNGRPDFLDTQIKLK